MSVMQLQKTDRGWIIELPEDFTDELGVEKGAIAVMYAKEGRIDAEIFPPPSPELEKAVERIHAKYKDAFAEMKRIGD